MGLHDPLFGWPAVDQVFADSSTAQRMLDFEAALARAEAGAGVIPRSAAEAIGSHCRIDSFDLASLSEAAAHAGNFVIPLLKELTAKVRASDEHAAGFVHWGATSQDVMDTATMLQMREALSLMERELARLRELVCDLALRHRTTPMAGRTWMQHGVPIVLGLKFAGWADALGRHAGRLARAREQMLAVQFGGAGGTLASLDRQGMEVTRALASELDLPVPAMPWHSHRDRLAELATVLGLLTGTLGKIGRDISLLSQTELDELSEPAGEGRGGSSSMPQKRNPVTAAIVLAAAARVPPLVSTMLAAMVQENERGLGGWHAEWETLPQIVRLAGGALHHLTKTVAGLEIRPGRMKTNLDATRGLIFSEAAAMALARVIGKSQAHELVQSCARRAISKGEHLRDVLEQDEVVSRHLSVADIHRLFEPMSYVGAADEFIDRVASSRTVMS